MNCLRLFEMKKKGDKVTERNTLRFRLKVRCKRNKKAPSDTTNPDELYINSKVYTRTIEWEPIGDQKNWIPGMFYSL
jgi:DNA-directed RNA polymerase I and III subunit RPAC1